MTPGLFLVFFLIVIVAGALSSRKDEADELDASRDEKIPTIGSLEDNLNLASPRLVLDDTHPLYSKPLGQDD